MMERTNDLQYPVGRYRAPELIDSKQREAWIAAIASLPAQLRDSVANLNDSQLDTAYRAGGWTVRQVIHHVPDSHMNSYIRFRLGLTETAPSIKPYDEASWARLEDAKTSPVEVSLTLLQALHTRWVTLLRSLSEADFLRPIEHPEWGSKPLQWMLGLYAWHGKHHLAHITELAAREGW